MEAAALIALAICLIGCGVNTVISRTFTCHVAWFGDRYGQGLGEEYVGSSFF